MKLGIYGGGGLGREALELSKQINDLFHKWNEKIGKGIFIKTYTSKSIWTESTNME